MNKSRHITAHRCPRGCLWLHAHSDCPNCGGALQPVQISNDAIVVSHTVVRINPTGLPICLGVARTQSGVSTLCVIHGDIRGNGRDRICLVMVDGRFHALARTARVRGFRKRITRSRTSDYRARAPRANRRYCRKN